MEKQLKMHTNFWWLQILLGVLFIGFGLWFWFTPEESYLTFAVLFSTYIFVTGIFEIINAISSRKHSSQWGIYLIGGIIDLILGGILIAHENLTMDILPMFLGFWILLRSSILIVMYFELKNTTKRIFVLLLISALLSCLFALVILAKPIIGKLTIVYITSLAFLFIGVYRIILGNILYKIRKH